MRYVDNYAKVRERAIIAARSVPPLPHKAVQVLRMLTTSDIDFAAVSKAIESDPVLASRVLQVANSSAFSRGGTIVSVRHAVPLLGVNALRRYAIGWSVLGVFNRLRMPKFWLHTEFLVHSTATAMLSDELARALHVREHDAAYVSGLIHDIGKLILAFYLPNEYFTVMHTQSMTGRPLRDCEMEAIGIDHAELSGIAATQWKLPQTVCMAVQYHHTPLLDPTGGVPLSLLVSKADSFVNSLGHSVVENEGLPDGVMDWPGCETQTNRALEAFRSSWPVSRLLVA